MPMLDKPTLELLQQTAVQAAGAENKAHVVAIDQEPDHIYGVVDSAGSFVRYEAEPLPRNHVLVTLDEVLKYAKHASGQVAPPKTTKLIEGPTAQPAAGSSLSADDTDAGDDDGVPTGETVVWYDRPAIVVVIDDLTRRDRATMRLNLTPQMKLLLELEDKERKFDQPAFRRLLKIELAGCRQDDAVLNWVSAMKFSNNSTSAGVITNQRTSLGQAIDDEALSELGSCPDEITLQVRVFDDPSLRETWPIVCAVEVLPAERSFRLVPLPLELHNAVESELSVIGQHLVTNLDCPVFRGQP